MLVKLVSHFAASFPPQLQAATAALQPQAKALLQVRLLRGQQRDGCAATSAHRATENSLLCTPCNFIWMLSADDGKAQARSLFVCFSVCVIKHYSFEPRQPCFIPFSVPAAGNHVLVITSYPLPPFLPLYQAIIKSTMSAAPAPATPATSASATQAHAAPSPVPLPSPAHSLPLPSLSAPLASSLAPPRAPSQSLPSIPTNAAATPGGFPAPPPPAGRLPPQQPAVPAGVQAVEEDDWADDGDDWNAFASHRTSAASTATNDIPSATPRGTTATDHGGEVGPSGAPSSQVGWQKGRQRALVTLRNLALLCIAFCCVALDCKR